MSINAKRAAAVLVIVGAFAIYRWSRAVRPTDTGGLGAVSAGISEAVVETLVLAAIVGALLYWRSRRQRSRTRQPAASPPRQG
jgi:drug/metabolite transporter superfamily protein YnfA